MNKLWIRLAFAASLLLTAAELGYMALNEHRKNAPVAPVALERLTDEQKKEVLLSRDLRVISQADDPHVLQRDVDFGLEVVRLQHDGVAVRTNSEHDQSVVEQVTALRRTSPSS